MRITYYSLFSRNPLFKYEKSENRGSSVFTEFSRVSKPLKFTKSTFQKWIWSNQRVNTFFIQSHFEKTSDHEIHFSKVDSVKTGSTLFSYSSHSFEKPLKSTKSTFQKWFGQIRGSTLFQLVFEHLKTPQIGKSTLKSGFGQNRGFRILSELYRYF